MGGENWGNVYALDRTLFEIFIMEMKFGFPSNKFYSSFLFFSLVFRGQFSFPHTLLTALCMQHFQKSRERKENGRMEVILSSFVGSGSVP